MRIFMRMLLTVYLLFVIFISGVVLACSWGLISAAFPEYWVSLIYNNMTVRIIVSVIGIAVIILSFTLMFSGIRKRKPKSAVIRSTGMGAISISLSALEEMTIRHITSHEAVRNCKAGVAIKDGKLNLRVRLSVAEGANIPDIMLSLQTSLKEHIETLAGIEVNKILLLVEKTSQVAKARVE